MATKTISVGHARQVVLPIDKANIKSTIRQGDALKITLKNGDVLILKDYYTEDERTLLLNPNHAQGVEQVALDSQGHITGTKVLSSEELAKLAGGSLDALSTHQKHYY